MIHLAESGTGPVGVDPLRKALAWGRYLSSHARRIYAAAVMADVAAAKRLVARIRKGDIKDGFTERDVYKNDWSGLDRESVKKALTVLVEHGWLSPQVEQTAGRSKTVFRINPRVLESSPEGTDKAAGSPWGDGESPLPSTATTDGSPADVSSIGNDHAPACPQGTDGTDRSSGEGAWGEL